MTRTRWIVTMTKVMVMMAVMVATTKAATLTKQ